MPNNSIKIFLVKILEFLSSAYHNRTAAADINELYDEILHEEGKQKANLWLIRQVFKSFPFFVKNFFYWGIIMIRNYTTISFRNIYKSKFFTLINIFGLAIGLASCTFIFLFVNNELSYDSFHNDHELIYRIPMVKKTETREARWGVNTAILTPTFKANFSEIEYMGRITEKFNSQVIFEDKKFYEYINYSDTDFLNIYNVQLADGNLTDCLTRPNTAVITKNISEKYFGHQSAVGRTIKVDTAYFEITAVINEVPSNSHLNFEILLSLESVKNIWWMNDWPTGTCFTYIKFKQDADIIAFENSIRNYAQRFSEGFNQAGIEIIYFLQPIADIHLYSNLGFEYETPGDPMYVYIFILVGILVLFIACMNFINLSTARSTTRANEVGIRKAVGALKKQIAYQFIYESIVLALVGAAVALGLVVALLPYFNSLSGLNISVQQVLVPNYIIIFFVFSAFLGVVAGFYPAIFISSFNPTMIFRNHTNSGKGGALLRKILVIGQFSISIILIISTMVIYRQVNFMRNQNLGFEKEHKLVLTFPETGFLRDRYEYIKTEFLKSPYVSGAAATSHIPGRPFNTTRFYLSGKENETGISIEYIGIDYDFIKMFGIEMLHGRGFNKNMGTDTSRANLMVNEAAVKALGFADISQGLHQNIWRRAVPIIGITKNFHIKGLQNQVEPLYMVILPQQFKYVTLTVNTNNINDALSNIETKWSALFPDMPISYFFLNDEFNKQYIQETQTSSLFRTFSILGVFIACLGLLGLSSFVVEKRKKEIGIRKVLGAGAGKLTFLLSVDFAKWILLANIAAWPAAYLFTNSWLENFAFKMDQSLDIYLISGLAALVIALATISIQTVKAALVNPVKSLKTE